MRREKIVAFVTLVTANGRPNVTREREMLWTNQRSDVTWTVTNESDLSRSRALTHTHHHWKPWVVDTGK